MAGLHCASQCTRTSVTHAHLCFSPFIPGEFLTAYETGAVYLHSDSHHSCLVKNSEHRYRGKGGSRLGLGGQVGGGVMGWNGGSGWSGVGEVGSGELGGNGWGGVVSGEAQWVG